jgi:2,3-bisphosphoglycerate-independent phosphoglycerate mutase
VLPDGSSARLRSDGSLRDIAPTLLGIADIPRPAEMTGRDLRLTANGGERNG